jgi:NAD+ synthase (glutamine-hydrolysing)
MASLRLALAQINCTVGDLSGNRTKILEAMERAGQAGANLVAFPELAVSGYPPEDLLLKPDFVEANLESLHKIAEQVGEVVVVVGFVDRRDDLYNAAAVLHRGAVAAVYHKVYLPNYSVFDEDRYFRAGSEPLVLVLGEWRVGLSVCEDIWYPDGPPVREAMQGDAHLLLNISASPYHAGKWKDRERVLAARAADGVAAAAMVNLVGGQDQLVFDGGSSVFNHKGEVVARAKQFEEDLLIVDLEMQDIFAGRLHDPRRRKEPAGGVAEVVLPAARGGGEPVEARVTEPLGRVDEVLAALELGLQDYVRKNGFQGVVLGISGGVDSAVTAAIATQALGPEAVVSALLPSQFSAHETQEDARRVAEILGIRTITIPIGGLHGAYLSALDEVFRGTEVGVAEENIQARIRGTLLMALSNKFGWLVITTGNKSELSTGYCTLYGDMAGGFAVLGDVTKTMVYEIARRINEISPREIIPQSVLERPPTAELKPDQRDSDTLPPYEVLDPILAEYIENDRSRDEIVEMGFAPETVDRVIRMVDGAEYKRRQAPPCIRVTSRAFGKDRRLPITNRYRQQ